MAKDRVEVDILAKTDKFKSGTKSVLGSLAKITAVIGSFHVLQSTVNQSIEAYKQQNIAEVKLTAALKATQNQIGMSTEELKTMATEMSNLTGIADETIIESQALMTTFTQIGGEVFPDALRAAQDMSAMFGQDLRSSTIQLGTALNDPIAGIGRLKRIGISFTDEQRAMIQSFMDANDVMGAQKIILDELQTEFGGVAEQMGTTGIGSLDKLKNAWVDTLEILGEQSVNLLKAPAEKLTKFLNENKENIAFALENLPELAAISFGTIAKIIERTFSFETLTNVFASLWGGMVRQAGIAIETIPKMFGAIIDIITAPFQAIGEFIMNVFSAAFVNVKNFGIDALNFIVDGINLVLSGLDVLTFWEEGDIGKIEKFVKDSVPEIENFGATWNRNMKEAGDSIVVLTENGTKLVKETVDNIGQVGSEIGSNYTDIIEGGIKQTAKLKEEWEKNKDVIEETTTATEENGETTEEVTENILILLGKIAEKHKENIKFMGTSVSQLDSVVGQFFQNEIDRTEKSGMAEKEKERKIAGLKRHAFIADKIAAVTQAGINTALSLTRPDVLGRPFRMALVSALGLAQAAAIQSKPVPSFAQGGSFMTSGPQLIQVGDNPSGVEKVTVKPMNRKEKMIQVLNIDGREFMGWLQDKIDSGDLRLARAS